MTEQTTNQDDTLEEAPSGEAEAEAAAAEAEATEASEAEDAAAETDDGSVDVEDAEATTDSAEDPDAPDTELGDLRDDFEALNDRHLRLVAEFNNFRRRSEQERMSAWARAQADLVAKLLDVLDDLQRVADLDLSNASVEAIMEGIDLVERKFMRQLSEAGVEVIEPEGEAFDPERMEAMMRVPAEDEDQVDTVAQVFQKGYSLKDTLVRPARVSVYTQG